MAVAASLATGAAARSARTAAGRGRRCEDCALRRAQDVPATLNALSPDTQVLNIGIAFEEALKLNLAIDECVRKLNSSKRSTTAGKRSGLNLAIYLSRGVITINEAKLPNP